MREVSGESTTSFDWKKKTVAAYITYCPKILRYVKAHVIPLFCTVYNIATLIVVIITSYIVKVGKKGSLYSLICFNCDSDNSTWLIMLGFKPAQVSSRKMTIWSRNCPFVFFLQWNGNMVTSTFYRCSLLANVMVTKNIYRKIPKVSPGAYIFQRPFLRGLYSEGLIYGGKFAFQNWLD